MIAEFEQSLEVQRKELITLSNFISEKGLKIKQAMTHDQQLDYFRGDNFHQVVLANKSEILSKLKTIKQITSLETMEDATMLGQLFVDFRLALPLERHLHAADDKKMKYPKHLVPARPQNFKFSEKGFYAWLTPKPYGKMAILLTLVIIIVIAFMLFSLWPLWLKIAIWYFSFYTLIFLVSISTSFISALFHLVTLLIDGFHHLQTRCMVVLVPLWH